MAGTKEGGLKAKAKVLAKYGKNYFAEIGRKGGKNGHTGGFASELIDKNGLTGRDRARMSGIRCGKIGKRGKAKKPSYKIDIDYILTPIERININGKKEVSRW